MSKLIDLTGRRFGRLSVVKYVGNKRWECLCDCGNTKLIIGSNLTKDNGTKSCGCLAKEQSAANGRNSIMDISGKRFGKLTALRYHTDKKQWECQCDCGNICFVKQNNLCRKTQKATISCGCAVDLQAANTANIVDGTNVGNIKRKAPNPNSVTGIKGVYYSATKGLYIAQIGWKGKRYYLGASHDVNVCAAYRRAAEERIYGNFIDWYENEFKPSLKREDDDGTET